MHTYGLQDLDPENPYGVFAAANIFVDNPDLPDIANEWVASTGRDCDNVAPERVAGYSKNDISSEKLTWHDSGGGVVSSTKIAPANGIVEEPGMSHGISLDPASWTNSQKKKRNKRKKKRNKRKRRRKTQKVKTEMKEERSAGEIPSLKQIAFTISLDGLHSGIDAK